MASWVWDAPGVLLDELEEDTHIAVGESVEHLRTSPQRLRDSNAMRRASPSRGAAPVADATEAVKQAASDSNGALWMVAQGETGDERPLQRTSAVNVEV